MNRHRRRLLRSSFEPDDLDSLNPHRLEDRLVLSPDDLDRVKGRRSQPSSLKVEEEGGREEDREVRSRMMKIKKPRGDPEDPSEHREPPEPERESEGSESVRDPKPDLLSELYEPERKSAQMYSNAIPSLIDGASVFSRTVRIASMTVSY
jgi:hypothetical protein